MELDGFIKSPNIWRTSAPSLWKIIPTRTKESDFAPHRLMVAAALQREVKL